jgi:NADPH:quinone reductase-like Zn-dependent oxidoreductase
MKAAIWNDHDSVEVLERPMPEPRPGSVRVKLSSVGIRY